MRIEYQESISENWVKNKVLWDQENNDWACLFSDSLKDYMLLSYIVTDCNS